MFNSLFKSKHSFDSENFRRRVLERVRATNPLIKFEEPASADLIIANGTQIGLQNLRAKYDQSDRSDLVFTELVDAHFRLVLRVEPSIPDYEVAKSQIRPQIMPLEYAAQAPILRFPFSRTLAIGIVINESEGYIYVRNEDAIRWNKSHQELLDVAIGNLHESSRGVELQSGESNEVKWIGIELKDGFDAARILIPKFREFLASQLGNPFCIGVPNRDFLICWNTAASDRFKEYTIAKLHKDFETQPYPLSPNIFVVSTEGTITESS